MPVFSVTTEIILIYSFGVENVLLLNIVAETVIMFSLFFDEYKVQKKSIYLK